MYSEQLAHCHWYVFLVINKGLVLRMGEGRPESVQPCDVNQRRSWRDWFSRQPSWFKENKDLYAHVRISLPYYTCIYLEYIYILFLFRVCLIVKLYFSVLWDSMTFIQWKGPSLGVWILQFQALFCWLSVWPWEITLTIAVQFPHLPSEGVGRGVLHGPIPRSFPGFSDSWYTANAHLINRLRHLHDTQRTIFSHDVLEVNSCLWRFQLNISWDFGSPGGTGLTLSQCTLTAVSLTFSPSSINVGASLPPLIS